MDKTANFTGEIDAVKEKNADQIEESRGRMADTYQSFDRVLRQIYGG